MRSTDNSRPDQSSHRSTDTDAARRRARPALLVAAAVLWLEALAVVIYAILILINSNNVSAGVGIGVAGMLLAWGAGLALVGRGVALVRSWARGPAVALQLLHLPIAFGFRHSIDWLSTALFVTAGIVLVAVFLPASTAAFTAGRQLPGQQSNGQGTDGTKRR